MKKAMVERLKQIYHRMVQEDGASYPVVYFMKDIVTIGLDTSGVSLHKRGYRQLTVKAPITETLASALIMLTPWNKDRISGRSILRKWNISNRGGNDGSNIAPGMNRSFTAENGRI